jgi:hypothetical protein
MLWRLTKAIIVSWLVGVVCGAGMVIVMQNRGQTPAASDARILAAPQTSGSATVPAGGTQ